MCFLLVVPETPEIGISLPETPASTATKNDNIATNVSEMILTFTI